jgi:hypothetical protein
MFVRISGQDFFMGEKSSYQSQQLIFFLTQSQQLILGVA